LLAYIGPHVDPWALKQRTDNVGRHSSPAPLIAAVSENFLPKAPEVQT
jgi:mannose-6-phosphate isomerase